MRLTAFLLFTFFYLHAFAQVADSSKPSGTDSTSRLQIIKAGRYNFEKKDTANSFLSLAVDVQLKQGLTLFYADSAVLNQNTSILEAFGNVHINDDDSIHTYAKYMRYNGKEKKAFLKNNVRLTDSKGSVLTTQELNYDLNTKIAVYTTGGKVVNKKTVLTSKQATYYEDLKSVTFKKDVVLVSPDYSIYTDSLIYNTEGEIATFVAPTTIVNGKRKIYTTDGYYDLKLGKAVFAKRSSIVDSTYSLVANQMAFDDKQGLGQFRGNVVFIDTANGVTLISEQLFANKKSGSFLATEKPLMILKQDNDSVFVTADTLFSGKITDLAKNVVIPVITDTLDYKAPDLLGKDSSMNRMFMGWHHVRIFSDSLQAVCDSLFYAGTDSAFRLFTQPIVWANNSQISADTMYLFTKKQKPDRLRAFFNGFIVNKTGKAQFNQVKGNTVNAWFKEGEIDYVRAKGRAESVYYAQDEQNRFVGMNRATSDAVDMFFANRRPVKVKFINDLKGITYPIKQVPSAQDKLTGFSWQDERRPKTRFDLIGK
jgi:lipopolysaccharide export system protein LptA